MYDDLPFYGKVCALINPVTDSAPCEFGIACGAIALIVAVIFIIVDIVTDVQAIAPSLSKPSCVASAVVSLVMAILWIAAFAYM